MAKDNVTTINAEAKSETEVESQRPSPDEDREKDTSEKDKDTSERKVNVKVKSVRKLPSALMIGAQRCNLQFLSDVLKFNPKVVVQWGPDYFNTVENYEKGLDWYLDHLPKTPEDKILIERNSEYYSAEKIAKRVYDTVKDIKLIFMACDPTKRTINHYRSMKAQDENLGSIETLAIDPIKKSIITRHDFINNSMYSQHIKNWLKYFPKKQLFVLDDHVLTHDMQKELSDLESFLEVEPHMSKAEFYFNETRGTHCGKLDSEIYCFGHDKRFRKPNLESPEPIPADTVRKLRDFFHQHNEDFYRTIGREFLWNNR